MPFEWNESVDTERCRASVSGRGRSYQCQRKPKIDGKWCRQHSPEAEKAKAEAANKRYLERSKYCPHCKRPYA